MRQRLERKISFLCLFILIFIFAMRICRFILFTFYRLPAFFHPHFPILQTPLFNLLTANNVLTRGLPVDQIYKRLSL